MSDAPKRKRKSRAKSARDVPPAGGKTPAANGVSVPSRLASAVKEKNVQWLWYPWIPAGMLTLVVGTPCVGKSTFLAAIIAYATGAQTLGTGGKRAPGRAVMLPGHEEDVSVMTLPRLRANGADLGRVKLVDQASVALIRDRDKLASIVKEFGATLLIGDPIDSYVDEGMGENNGQDVRPLLEAAAWIGTQTGAAVVFARHPGKDDGNVMPGSRMWRAVPRSILQLTSNGAVPPRFLLSHYKDSLGTQSTPRHYTLKTGGQGPPKFTLEEEVDQVAEDLAKSANGPTGRYKLMQACRLIRWVFALEDSPTRQQLGEEGRKQGLGEDTISEALRLLGVRSVPPAERGMPWRLVRTIEEWPLWLAGVVPPGPTLRSPE